MTFIHLMLSRSLDILSVRKSPYILSAKVTSFFWPSGVEGPTGLEGDQGPAGPQGPSGRTGTSGNTGQPGEQTQKILLPTL